jgi:hypothetical protein
MVQGDVPAGGELALAFTAGAQAGLDVRFD